MVDVPTKYLLAAPRIVGDHKRPGSLFLQDTAAHAALEGTRNIAYHGNRSGCPEKIHDLVSTGAAVQAVGALDDPLDRLYNNNFSTLVGHIRNTLHTKQRQMWNWENAEKVRLMTVQI